MKILFDHGTPVPLRHMLLGHEVSTAYELGWDQLVNGELLKAAEGRFEAMITTDQSLQYQQNLEGRQLAIAVLSTTNWPRIKPHVEMVLLRVSALKPGDFQIIEIPY
jgi:hypothetical protein